MSGSNIVPKVVALFEASCARQFQNLGAYIKQSDHDFLRSTSMDGFVSVRISADSEDLSIQLCLSVPGAFLRETMPVIEVDNDSIVLYQEDWCMELANRFLGDLKNQLLSYNCLVRMGLPKLIDDTVDNVSVPAEYESVERLFLIDSHLLAQIHNLPLAIRLHVNQLNKDLVFDEREAGLDDDDCFEVSELEHL